MKNIYNLINELDMLLEEVEAINSEIYDNKKIIEDLEKQVDEENMF
jgi:hypothetical protein